MRFLMLGPLDVVGDGAIPLRATKHKSLLATLLINGNQVVSMGSLIDTLWTEAPPTASNLVRQYVSRLRKMLASGRGTGVELHTHAAGYALIVPPRTTDTEEFEQLVRQARDQLDGGRPGQARETLGQALGLWRGHAFADVSWTPEILAEQARLEEVRVSARELRAEASLAAGELGDAVSELTGLATQYPLREHLHAQLMRALSVSGRKADALNVYHIARNNIVTELGLEPGQELRDLEQAILKDEPSRFPKPALRLTAGHRTTRPTQAEDHASLTPPQLPPALSDFVGRRYHLEAVHQLLSHRSRLGDGSPGRTELSGDVLTGPPVVVLCGLTGAGKTTLAVQLGHRLRADFPDGQIFLRLRADHGRPPLDPADALGRLIELLGRPVDALPSSLAARQRLYRAIIADRRVLLVLDDAMDECQVRPLLPTGSASAVLVTSRSRLAALDGAHTILLPMFSPDESVRLLASVVGSERVAAEPDTACAIADACEGLPFAVRAAAAVLAKRPHRRLRHLLERLNGDQIFEELVVGDHNLGELVADSYSGLAPEEQSMLRQLAADPNCAGTSACMNVISERDLPASTRLVDRLVDIGVLEFVGTDTTGRALFRWAGLVRRFALTIVDRQRDRRDDRGKPVGTRLHLEYTR